MTVILLHYSLGGYSQKNWIGLGVQPASQNPYPIYDGSQNLRFSLPYLWPDQKFDTYLYLTLKSTPRFGPDNFKIGSLVQTNVKDNVQRERGRQSADGRKGTWDEIEVASCKFNTSIQKSIPYLWLKSPYPIYDLNSWKTVPQALQP